MSPRSMHVLLVIAAVGGGVCLATLLPDWRDCFAVAGFAVIVYAAGQIRGRTR